MFKNWMERSFLADDVLSSAALALGASADDVGLGVSRETFWTRHDTAAGDGIVPLYRSSFTKEGVLQLVRDGEHDLYADIQSHAASTDLNMILERYFSGDPSALSRVQGVYMDVTSVPENYHEAMQLIDNARKDFAVLPPEVKERFDNDPNQWIASLGTADWLSKMQISSVSAKQHESPAEDNNQSAGDVVQGDDKQ